jgi:hypothetical protein
MSFQKCPHPPKACLSNMNPSWSPALQSEPSLKVPFMSLESDSSPVYYLTNGHHVRYEEIVAPELLAAIEQHDYLIRQIRESWWSAVENEEEPFANLQDTFLCRRDYVDYELLVKNPTEEERDTLIYKQRFMKNEMGYFRTIWIIVEYGTTYDGNQRWTRRTVAYLKGSTSPYPFQKDCRPEHHKDD